MEMNQLTVATEDNLTNLLDLAANNDVEGFKRSIEYDPSGIDDVGLWYGRQKSSKLMALEQRTPLMVAATYGSTDVLKLILSLSVVDVNRMCGLNKSTALHCAASGGSRNAVDVVKMLLRAGADPNLTDSNGHRPVDLIAICPHGLKVNFVLQELLAANGLVEASQERFSPPKSASNSPPLSPSPNNISSLSPSDSSSSPETLKSNDLPMSSPSERKEYPVDPSMPDIKNIIYATDEFRMFSFKIRPCSRAYSHDWTECPFVHPGENARRRDPRKYHYSCVPCPDFRKGACRRGDLCEYAHGVFECWLHPAQYRTRLCKDGSNCNRRVCFFAHTQEELRPLYVSTGSAIPSHSNTSAANAMDFATAMSLLSCSPSAVSAINTSLFTPPRSPAANGMPNICWSQPNVPTMHLPGSNLQSGRLCSLPKYDVEQKQLINKLSLLSEQTNSLNRSVGSMTLTPSNLEDMFCAEISSPQYSDQALSSAVFSPTQRSATLSQLHKEHGILSPINQIFSLKTVDHPPLQASFGMSPSGRMSPHNVEPPLSSRVSMLAQHEKQKIQFRSLSLRDNSFNSNTADSWSKWGSTDVQSELTADANDCSSGFHESFELESNGEEPDVSWVQSLVKEFPQERTGKSSIYELSVGGNTAISSDDGAQIEQTNQSSRNPWLERPKQLDHHPITQ